MQEKFIEELDNRGKERIKGKRDKIDSLMNEIETYSKSIEELQSNVFDTTKEQEKVTGSNKKLRSLNNLKGKLSNKVATITKEHKFFTDNVSCLSLIHI